MHFQFLTTKSPISRKQEVILARQTGQMRGWIGTNACEMIRMQVSIWRDSVDGRMDGRTDGRTSE